MPHAFIRTEMVLGKEAMDILASSRVAVFGIGGVGGYVVEALARSGIGALDLIDYDTVDLTNLNRQIIATYRTLSSYKVDAAAERIAQIAPECRVTAHRMRFLPETEDRLDFRQYDYVVDAVDTVTAKLALAEKAGREGTPVISCMGTGNKMDPSKLRTGDIYETSVCPLARVMRRECRKRGIARLKVVYSREEPVKPRMEEVSCATPDTGRRSVPGSFICVPAAAGLLIAAEVVRDLTGK